MKQVVVKWDEELIAKIDAEVEAREISRTKWLQEAAESFLVGATQPALVLAHDADAQLLAENKTAIQTIERMANRVQVLETENAALRRATAKANTVSRPTSAATRARANAATVVAPSPMFKPSAVDVSRKMKQRSAEQQKCQHDKAHERHVGFAIKCGDCGLVLR